MKHSFFNAALMFESQHRKKYLEKPVRNKRYIRGILNNQVKEKIHSRKTGQKTTDPMIRQRVLDKTNGMCYICKRQYRPALANLLPHLFFDTVQIDHIVPFSKMGSNSISNYLPICRRCNIIKSDTRLGDL